MVELVEALPASVDTLVIGAGVIGSAIAMHLAERGVDVVAIDPDLGGALSSSERNAGGARATWWRRVNIELCAATIDWFRLNAAAVGFRQLGYLWLYPPDLWPGAVRHVDDQNVLARNVELLEPAEITRRWPFVDNLDGVSGGTFSPLDGLVNANAVREHYRARARAAGGRFVDRAFAESSEGDGDRIGTVRVRLLENASAAERVLIHGAPSRDRIRAVACRRVVNAAGPWASRVASALGWSVPCRAVRRQVSLVRCRDVDLSACGMIVDTTGCYFHHEAGGLVLAGFSPPDDPPGFSFVYDGRAFFEAEIWPRLAHRISAMDRLEHVRGWAGLYELSPDNSALLGPVAGFSNVFEAHSFSGRGVMQSYGAALALAELITEGRSRASTPARSMATDSPPAPSSRRNFTSEVPLRRAGDGGHRGRGEARVAAKLGRAEIRRRFDRHREGSGGRLPF